MKQNTIIKSTACLLALALLAGCAKWKSTNNKTKGAIIGATSGAVIGGMLGKGKNRALGVILGATLGGAGGAVIGFYMDRQKKDLEKDLEKQNEGLPPEEQVTVERVGEGLNITMGSGILFDVGKANLKPAVRQSLDRMSETFKKYHDTNIVVSGHTDSDGSDAFNMNLSEQRAQSVANYLAGLGIPRSRLLTRGYGEGDPVADNATTKGKQQNRRVELAVYANENLKKDAADGKLDEH
jgi:outer membrane protein OmpA-like peptidoglycan-associated protein